MKTKALLCVLLGLQLFTSTVFSQFVAHRRARHFNARDVGASSVLDARWISGISASADLGTWSDRSGNGQDATEATNRPTYEVAVQGGAPAVRFNGTSDLMTVSAFDCDAGHVFILTFVLRGNGSGDGYYPVISYMPDGGTDRGAPLYAKSGGTWASYPRYIGVGGNDNFDGSGAWAADAPYVATFVYPTAPAAWTAALNGLDLDGGNSTGAANGTGFLIARQATPSRYSHVDMLQVIGVPSDLSTSVLKLCRQHAGLAFKIATN